MALSCALTLRCLRGRPGCAMHPMGTLWPQQPCHAPHGDPVAVPCTPRRCPGHATCVLHPMGISRPCLGPCGDVLAVPATSHAPWGQTGCTLQPVGTRWPCRPCPEHGAPRGQASRAGHPRAVPAMNGAAVAEGTCCQGDPLAARDGAEGGRWGHGGDQRHGGGWGLRPPKGALSADPKEPGDPGAVGVTVSPCPTHSHHAEHPCCWHGDGRGSPTSNGPPRPSPGPPKATVP